MKQKVQKTYATTPSDVDRRWWIVDAKGKTLGRLASRIAPIITGKNKPNYAPYIDTGDFVIIINSDKIHVTGRRMDQKVYYRYSGYQSGLKKMTLREMLKRHPERAVQLAIKGMLPKGALGHQMINKLKVYAGDSHPHEAQKPEILEL
jgi:large subunit ribosomal protein L13